MRDHRKLRAFELADALALSVFKETQGFPGVERFGLGAHLRKSAVSIPSNIVEGCARVSEADYKRFLDIAFASARELEYQIDLALRLGLIKKQSTLPAQAQETCKVIFGIIQSLR